MRARQLVHGARPARAAHRSGHQSRGTERARQRSCKKVSGGKSRSREPAVGKEYSSDDIGDGPVSGSDDRSTEEPTAAPKRPAESPAAPRSMRNRTIGRGVPTGTTDGNDVVSRGCGRCCTRGCSRLTEPLHACCCVQCSESDGQRHAPDCDDVASAANPPAPPPDQHERLTLGGLRSMHHADGTPMTAHELLAQANVSVHHADGTPMTVNELLAQARHLDAPAPDPGSDSDVEGASATANAASAAAATPPATAAPAATVASAATAAPLSRPRQLADDDDDDGDEEGAAVAPLRRGGDLSAAVADVCSSLDCFRPSRLTAEFRNEQGTTAPPQIGPAA